MQTIDQHWRCGQAILAAAGIEAARLEARLMLEHLAGLRHVDFLTAPERPLAPELADRFTAWLNRRVAGEPLAYLTGESEFRGRVFRVSPAVLIPRPETELLVDQALVHLAGQAAPSVVDLGTGSGIIAISLALECPAAQVTAVDVSPDALAVASANAAALGATVDFCLGDWFGPLGGRRFDLIVSNPPYVADGDPHLQRHGLPFEPQGALTDGADGLTCLRHIVADAPAHLHPGGWLLLEHGHDQGAACRNLLQAAGFKAAFTLPDLAGLDRVSGGHL